MCQNGKLYFNHKWFKLANADKRLRILMCQTLTGPEDSFLTIDMRELCFKLCGDLWTQATYYLV